MRTYPRRRRPNPSFGALLRVNSIVLILAGCAGASIADIGGSAADRSLSAVTYETELFRVRYRLDDPAGLEAYIKALDAAMERSKKEEPLEEAFKKDPLHHKLPEDFVTKKIRRAMKATRKAAEELASATGADREKQLHDVYAMAGAIRASYMRVVPSDMSVFTAVVKEKELRQSPVGLGKDGPAVDIAANGSDPILPSSYWVPPADIKSRDLYYGFERTSLPSLDGQICTYKGPKEGYGTHGGFDVSCDRYKSATLKFGKWNSQPFAHRVFWALGYHTAPANYVPSAKVQWDRRVLTEFNVRKDQSFSIRLAGIAIHTEHLQHYVNPFDHLAEVIMADEQGKEVSIKQAPDWSDFKSHLFKHPGGHPETAEGNFNDAFANRIHYFVYRDVNLEIKNEETDESDEGELLLGNWDWGGEGNERVRENRGAALVSAWLNQFDPRVCNNKLTVIGEGSGRQLKHYISDVGVALGTANDSTTMKEQLPNEFPWVFTKPAKPGEKSIPLDGSYHPIQECEAFKDADIDDAKWIAGYMAQLTGDQILQALVASGLPSAQVRLYYDKLVNRRNHALADLGVAATPIKLMDETREFDYDPRKDGPISIVTAQGEKVTAPDDDWVVVKGRCYTRADVASGAPARYAASEHRRLANADYWHGDNVGMDLHPVAFMPYKQGFTFDTLAPMHTAGIPAHRYDTYPEFIYTPSPGLSLDAAVFGTEKPSNYHQVMFYGLGAQKQLFGRQARNSHDWLGSLGGYAYTGPNSASGETGYFVLSSQLTGNGADKPFSLFAHVGGKVETFRVSGTGSTGVRPFVGANVSMGRKLFLFGEYSPHQSWEAADLFSLGVTYPIFGKIGPTFGIEGNGYRTYGFIRISL